MKNSNIKYIVNWREWIAGYVSQEKKEESVK